MSFRVFVSTSPEGEPPNWSEVDPVALGGPTAKILAVDEFTDRRDRPKRNEEAQLVAELGSALNALLEARRHFQPRQPAPAFRWTAEAIQACVEAAGIGYALSPYNGNRLAEMLNAYMDRSKPEPQDRHTATPQVVKAQAEMMYERASKPEPEPDTEPDTEPEAKADKIDPADLAWFKLLLRQAVEKLAPLQEFLDHIAVPDKVQEPADEAFRLLNYILRKD